MDRLGFTRLWPVQADELRARVAGRKVWELGCGRGELARWMAKSAERVHGVDKAAVFGRDARRCAFELSHFHTWRPPFEADVVVVAWPVTNGTAGLVELLRRAPAVVYVGQNSHHTACGSADLWTHLLGRELLADVPAPEGAPPSDDNALMVYGAVQGGLAARTREEALALVRVLGFEMRRPA